MGCLEETNICIRKLIRMMNHPKPISKQETVYLGVDVGTANVVTVAVDAAGQPLGGKISAARVVREGMIVDYLQAVDIVTNHVESLKDELDHELIYASSSFPPGTETGNIRVTENILEAARLQIVGMIDEPTVAATALGINNGIVVDVGGGTTGVSILKDGKAIKSYDEATGGFQFDLVIAGCLKITTQEAEAIKRDAGQQKKMLPIVRPVMEKVCSIIHKAVVEYSVGDIYLVGGSCSYNGFPEVIEKELGVKTHLPENPLYVTPLGIAVATAQIRQAL